MGQAVCRAHLSNALSGLPGAVLLEAEVAERVPAKRPLAFVLAGLDNFKPYNDYYGLARGDTVLLALARLGREVSSWRRKRRTERSPRSAPSGRPTWSDARSIGTAVRTFARSA